MTAVSLIRLLIVALALIHIWISLALIVALSIILIVALLWPVLVIALLRIILIIALLRSVLIVALLRSVLIVSALSLTVLLLSLSVSVVPFFLRIAVPVRSFPLRAARLPVCLFRSGACSCPIGISGRAFSLLFHIYSPFFYCSSFSNTHSYLQIPGTP